MRVIVFLPLLLTVASTAGAQESQPAPDEADAAAKRNAEYMNELVRSYSAYALGEDGTKVPLRLHETSLLNWSNPVSGVRPGGVQQMRQVIEGFAVYDGFQEKTEWVLRLLPKPLYRYSCPVWKVLDGAVFAFVQGTNPEVLVVLEARRTTDKEGGQAWYSGVARQTCYPARATYRNQPVWSVPLRYARQTKPEDVFYVRRFGQTATVPKPTP